MRLVIIGRGQTRSLGAQYAQALAGSDCWTLNSTRATEATMHWDIHAMRWDGSRHTYTSNGAVVNPALDQLNIPVMTCAMVGGVKQCVVYPFAGVEAEFCSDYYANTVAYMLAYSIYIGVHDEIVLCGCDMVDRHEAMDERPCLEYWIRIAQERGIAVLVPTISNLFKHQQGIDLRYGGNGQQRKFVFSVGEMRRFPSIEELKTQR